MCMEIIFNNLNKGVDMFLCIYLSRCRCKQNLAVFSEDQHFNLTNSFYAFPHWKMSQPRPVNSVVGKLLFPHPINILQLPKICLAEDWSDEADDITRSLKNIKIT